MRYLAFFKFKVNKHLVVQSYCELEVHLNKDGFQSRDQTPYWCTKQ